MMVCPNSMEDGDYEHSKPSVRICKVERNLANGSCGFNLTRTKWDPYPWIEGVEKDSPAELAGLKIGDCILEVNGEDIIGLRVMDIAKKALANKECISLVLWNAGNDSNCDTESICCAPMPTSLTRLSSCLSNILSALECPVCFEVIPPPAHQCPLGHLICFKCHSYTERCPICRTRFSKDRNILADKTYDSLVEAFQLKTQPVEVHSKKLWERLFGKKKLPKVKIDSLNRCEVKNKFLTRLIGKSSSVENLSSKSRQETFSLRKKSLSSTELFRPCRSKFLSSDYSSCHESTISLYAAPDDETPLVYRCPCNKNCSQLVTSNEIMYHIQQVHDGPILQYFQTEFTLHFPLSFPDLTIVTMFCYEKLFFVKIETSGDIKVHIWLLGSLDDVSKYRAVATIYVPESDHNTELTFKTFIYPLAVNDCSSVIKDQVIVTKNTIETYFSNSTFSLNVGIISMT